MDEDEPAITSSNFSLEYATQEGQNHQVSKAADSTTNMSVIRRVCGQTWTKVRVKYYNY